jgi:peptidoglycan/LPS O-acetylase OafA/YrhL
MQEVGRLSYSWYLWHWPFLVIGQIHFDTTAPALRIALVLASLVVAALTHHLIENPVRFAPLVDAHRPNWIMSAALVVVILVASVGIDRWAEDELTEPPPSIPTSSSSATSPAI